MKSQEQAPSPGNSLEERFHRIWSDYTKLKAQQSVLKRAVLDEQKHSQELKLILKETEHQLRIQTQQADTARFHNQRLTKRIEALQNDLAAKKSVSWFFSAEDAGTALQPPSISANMDVLTLELQSKIKENEELHQRVQELDSVQERLREQMQKQANGEREAVRLRQDLSDVAEQMQNLKKHSEMADEQLQRVQARFERARLELDEQRNAYETIIGSVQRSGPASELDCMSFLKRQDLWRDAVHVLKCIDFWRNRLKCIQRSCTRAAQLQDMQNVIGQECLAWDKVHQAWPANFDTTSTSVGPFFEHCRKAVQTTQSSLQTIVSKASAGSMMRYSGETFIQNVSLLLEILDEITKTTQNSNPVKSDRWFLLLTRLFVSATILTKYLGDERQWVQERRFQQSSDWVLANETFINDLRCDRDGYWRIVLRHSIIMPEPVLPPLPKNLPTIPTVDESVQTEHSMLQAAIQTDLPTVSDGGNDAPPIILHSEKASSTTTIPSDEISPKQRSVSDTPNDDLPTTQTIIDTDLSIKIQLQWPPISDADTNHRQVLLKQYYEKQIDQLKTTIQELDSRAAWYCSAWESTKQQPSK